jgi:micrococcal nuclease
MMKIIKKFGMVLFICAIFLDAMPAAAEEWLSVRKVYDGDTIELQNGVHVRYIGINAPEISHENLPAEPFALEAMAFNEKMVSSRRVRLQTDQETSDQYRRMLAYVFLNDGTFVNQEMVRSGLAYVLYTAPNTTYDDVLLKTQQEAMKTGKGIWANWKEKNTIYSGNRSSRRFHLKTCALGQRISSQNRIQFNRKWDAFWAGYAPCKKCKADPF